jgi:hypothetical protein
MLLNPTDKVKMPTNQEDVSPNRTGGGSEPQEENGHDIQAFFFHCLLGSTDITQKLIGWEKNTFEL